MRRPCIVDAICNSSIGLCLHVNRLSLLIHKSYTAKCTVLACARKYENSLSYRVTKITVNCLFYTWRCRLTIKGASRKFGVLVLCGGIYPDTTGGAEVHLYYVCRELAERGYRVYVISPMSKLSTRASETNVSFVQIYIKLWPYPFATLSYIMKSFAESLLIINDLLVNRYSLMKK